MTGDATSSGNPYSPPKAPVGDPTPDVPSEVLKKIKHGWIAALISAAITLMFVLSAVFSAKTSSHSVFEIADVILMCGLAYGIYRKSRVCAVAMFVYLIATKIAVIIQTGRPTGINIASAIFAYFFLQAMVGTFTYHKLLKRSPAGRGHG